jgi:DNA helicase-2/ATP-dependent DNA helicase PcrA
LPEVRAGIRAALAAFVQLIDRLTRLGETMSVADLLEAILGETGYREYLQESDEAHAEARRENVQELIEVARQYQDLEGGASLSSFLEEVALVADVDDPSADAPDAVTLTTLHAAKGLEYPVVFIPGMEEGLLPHIRSIDDPAQLEEERRICYVGMTRAKERLYLLHAASRFHQGSTRRSIRSRFLDDVPEADLARPAATTATGLTARERRAALAERKPQEDVPQQPAHAPGDRVVHAQFGRGVVVSCELVPGDQQVTVAFEGRGVKKLMLSFAPLAAEDAEADAAGDGARVESG